MNYRKLIIGLVVAALIGSTMAVAQPTPASSAAGTASSILFGADTSDEVVEGHTVHSEIEVVEGSGSDQAAAVVNVQQRQNAGGMVLWFDDSFLHRGAQAGTAACAGSVWATHSSGVLLSNLDMYSDTKTYRIDTPQRADWLITQYDTDVPNPLTRAWAVNLDCPVAGEGYVTNAFPTYDPANGGSDATPQDVDPLEYNAVLWFELGFGNLGFGQGLFEQAQFGEGGYDAETHDTTEGNSHPYNPNATQPGVMHNHSTVQVNLYYLEDTTATHGDVDFDNNEAFAFYHEDEEPGEHEGVT